MMTEGSADNVISLHIWTVRLCKWCWHGRRFLFGTVFLSILLNLIAALPLVDPSTLHSLPISWLFSHWLLLLALFVFLLLLTTLCGLIARLSAPLSKRQLLVRYLEQVTRDTELATLKGIPAGLIAESVRLADIYIPPHFYANRTRVDFPVSEDELERYRQSLKRGLLAPDLERVLFEAEKNWHHVLKQGNQVGLDVIWQQLNDNDAIVIQGYPGMGKSTLMDRLTLHMAERGLHHPDPQMPECEKLTPILIPVLLRLGSYARVLVDQTNLPLPEYLCHVLDDMDLPGLTTYMQQNLLDGACLVMLDGLDEVSDPTRREQVQREIRDLIVGKYHLCRFIITSRVAGYDQAAFPAYPHFMLAELTNQKEIVSFLRNWYRANLNRNQALRVTMMSEANIGKEAERQVQQMMVAITENAGVRELAKNPLLLTLLLVMQQNSIVLPRQRVELYDTVTKTLLENRNIAKDLKEVPEFQAIERLGPLAFQMQETDSDFVRQRDVEEALMNVIRCEGGTEEQVRLEAQRFLQRIRERGGLFVSRVGDYFGFIHRTFQEYFAARYILNQMKTDQPRWLSELIQLARRQDALWREPFLLAVAYQSKENERIADEILCALLASANENSFGQEISAVLLAANAIIESKPLTLSATLQQSTAERLLACYERALYTSKYDICRDIEDLTLRWLCSLPKEAYRLPFLDVISQAIKETQQVTRQRAILTLLTLIAPRLEPCPGLVFEKIIPPLLALTKLPAFKPYSPTTDLAITSDFDVADLALCVLSFMGRPGAASLYLESVRNYFEKRPEQLRLLSRYSLECGTLISPVMAPRAKENYNHYKNAIEQWKKLRERAQQHITEQHVAEGFSIQQSLFTCAEEVNYPITYHLLAMLEHSEVYAEHPWSEIWQAYLLKQLNVGSYIDYRELTLLWNVLFPKEQLYPLIDSVRRHLTDSDATRNRYAKRLILYLSRYWKSIRIMIDHWEAPVYMDDSDTLIKIINLYHLESTRRNKPKYRYNDRLFSILGIHSIFGVSRNFRKPIDLSYLADISFFINLKPLKKFGDLENMIDLIDLGSLSNLLITRDLIDVARMSLPTVRKDEKIDLLAIIEGRLLQFQINEQIGSEVEAEVPLLARAALQELALPNIEEDVQKIALDVLKALPARTSTEIAFIWKLLNETQDERIQDAYAFALSDAQPDNDLAWRELDKGKGSSVKTVRRIVEKRTAKRAKRDA